jgi:D-alanyl-D-alanine carboxypeptidase/D-alanyl-D-alanine-endopeptidase (penicillin-binding protein 4)
MKQTEMFKSLRNILLALLLIFFFNSQSYSGGGQIKLAELKAKIDSILKSIDNCTVSAKLMSASKNDVLYEYEPNIKIIPASITKLITASTAIYVLGTGYQFKTIVYTDDINIKEGVINGNVYIKGFGDPDFTNSDVTNLAQQICNKGIKTIKGNIIYDDSFLDDKHYGLANYYKGDTQFKDWPYVCALSLDKNKQYKNPPNQAAQYLLEDLKAKEVQIDGIVVSGVTPSGSKELAIIQRSLFEVISNMNKPSDNQSAITLYKVIGAVYDSPPGTLKKGTEAIIDFLTSINTDRGSYDFVEGSGLSRYNYVTASLYMRLLKYMYDDEKTFETFYQSLAIAGIDGTLKKRMVNTEAEKNIHAKTGTLRDVSTLTGYAVSRDNELLMFYIAMNGVEGKTNYYRNRQDDICDLICQFTRK